MNMSTKHTAPCIFACIFLITLFGYSSCAGKKPIYIVGHMTNSISEVIPYLDEGANALESDVQFYANGSVKEIYHGCPGDCFRACDRSDTLSEYLKHLRNITDPSASDTYYQKLILQFFDLKLDSSIDKIKSGHEVARHIFEYLWSNGSRDQEVRALIYINDVKDRDAIYGFLQEFKDRGQESRLKDVGFDGGLGNIDDIREMFQDLQLNPIWQGDGNFNCISSFLGNERLSAEIDVRDSNGYIRKVYNWTIDLKFKMRKSLLLGVDGFITNIPANLVQVLNEPAFKDKFRVATTLDPPFDRYEG